MPSSPQPIRISLHALRCFAERSKGAADLPKSDLEAMAMLEVRHGVDPANVEQVIRRIVSCGSRAGASSIRLGDLSFVLDQGRIVTIAHERKRCWRGPRVARGDD